MGETELEDLEIGILLEGIRRRWGYDFSQYSSASLKRRLRMYLTNSQAASYTDLLDKVIHDARTFDNLLKYMSITVTEMFRDPVVYKSIRNNLVPVFKTFPFVKIWHAGCATGEEAYSMAILLYEEDFLHRSRIYATDFNKDSLDQAEKGMYPIREAEKAAESYVAADGKRNFKNYYHTAYDFVKMESFLKERMTFSYHNLATDGVFGEMNLICCRNVLIYFNKKLQSRVLSIFTESLRLGGFLCLGNKETLDFSAVRKLYEPVDAKNRIYRKIGELK